MPTVIITGVAGFIGMHTAIRMLEDNWNVIGIDNLNDYYSVELKKHRLQEIKLASLRNNSTFEFHPCDLNSNIWEELHERDINGFIHLAAQAGVRYSISNPRAYIDSNILGFQSVLEFVSEHGISPFVYASSSSVYGKFSSQPFHETENCARPESYYAATKKANELMAYSYYRTAGLRSIGLRFFTVYGPWGRPDMAPFIFARAAFEGKKIQVFNYGEQKRDFTYIDDIVEGIYLSVVQFNKVKDARVFNIGNGSPVELMAFINEIERATGKTLEKEFVKAQTGDVAVTYADTTNLLKTFGYKPKVLLNEGVSNFVQWYRSYHETANR